MPFPITRLAGLLAPALFVLSHAAAGADLAVEIQGIGSDRGEIGCALFNDAHGFPLETASARVQWHPARRAGVTCRFDGLTAGTYAVAVSHDLNGNRKTDANLFGIPAEDWGVSGNVRPSLRAPRFSEAAFEVAARAGRRSR
jgi:uncharacterized protein (DUF2141 family)